jgi:hypothetical protein
VSLAAKAQRAVAATARPNFDLRTIREHASRVTSPACPIPCF